MNDNFFDFFGESLFGKDDSELNKFFKEHFKDMNQYSKDESSDKLSDDEHERKAIEVQDNIKTWLNQGFNNGELRTKISSIYGQPSNIRKFEIDGMSFDEITWHIENAGDTTIIMSSSDIDITFYDNIDDGIHKILREWSDLIEKQSKPKEKSLQEQLDEAILNEEYKKCAIIRDKIKALI
jgi:hypothetical protein